MAVQAFNMKMSPHFHPVCLWPIGIMYVFMGNGIISPLNPDFSEFITLSGLRPAAVVPRLGYGLDCSSDYSNDFQNPLPNEYLNGGGAGRG